MNTLRLLLLSCLAGFSLLASADWLLDAITYHNYCPPAAIKAKLCLQGQDFTVESNVKSQEVGAFITPPKEIGAFVINRMTEADGDLLLGSRVRVVWQAGTRVKKFDYLLLDRWQDLDLDDLVTGDLLVTNILGRTFTATVLADGGMISIRGLFTEPANNSLPVNYIRDTTMTFTKE